MEAGMDLSKLFSLSARFRDEAQKAHDKARVERDHQRAVSLFREADIWLQAAGELYGLAGDIIEQREHQLCRVFRNYGKPDTILPGRRRIRRQTCCNLRKPRLLYRNNVYLRSQGTKGEDPDGQPAHHQRQSVLGRCHE